MVAALQRFEPVQETKCELQWASLKTINLSSYDDGLEAQKALAVQLRDALHEQGFFYLTGHGFSLEDMNRVTDIGWTVLSSTPLEEKKELEAKIQENKSYKGFKLRNYWKHAEGVTDKIEQFNWSRKMDQRFPKAMEPYQAEIAGFTAEMHKGLLFKLLRLCALGLELPIDTFVDKHRFELDDESWMRWMAYYDEHSKEDEAKSEGLWMPGHADFSTISILFSQPMACLQVKELDGSWSNVRHIPGSMIINVGQFMSWYSGEFYKAAIHRVAAPPDDQRNHVRFGTFFFVVPNNDELCETLMQSPVLQRAAVTPLETPVTSKVYCNARIAGTGKTDLFKKKPDENGVRHEVIAGVKTKWY